MNEGPASIFFAIDHCSLEVVGIHAAKRGTRFEALEPLRRRPFRRSVGKSSGRTDPYVTTTAASSSPAPTRKNSAFWDSKARRLSCVSPKATASPNALS